MSSVVNHQWKTFRANKWLLTALIAVVIFNLLHWGLVIYKAVPTDLPVFLHYTTILGVDVTGPWYGLFVLPLTGTIIVVVNMAMSLFREDVFTPYAAMILAALCQLALIGGSILLFVKDV